jgi:predicted RNase H-like HicB family nuclease
MEIQFTTQIFKEGRTFVAHTRELDLSSCGGTQEKALKNLKEAVRMFLEEAEKLGTLGQILGTCGAPQRGAGTDGTVRAAQKRRLWDGLCPSPRDQRR